MALLVNIVQADQVCDQKDDCCSSSCCDQSSGRFFIMGDLIYWKTHISGLELNFGKTDISKFVNSCCKQVILTEEFDTDPHFDWKAGYRITAGYQSNCNNWGMRAIWTHFHDKACRKKSDCWNHRNNSCFNENSCFTGLTPPSFSDSSFTNINVRNRGKCTIKLDQFDIVLDYYASSKSFSMNPFAGLRFTRIDEDLNVELVTPITLTPPVFDLTSTTVATETRLFDDSQSFRGIGPVFGAQLDWNIGCGFSLYGTAAASLLYGKYKVHFNDSHLFTDPLLLELFNCNDKHLHRFTWNVDLAIGIQWQTQFCDSFQLIMNLGFEHHQYFDQNHLGLHPSDLAFAGGIFSIGIAL